MSVSTDRRFSRAGQKKRSRGAALRALERSPVMLEALDAARIARGLTEKYGADALAFAEDRARRAVEIGDDVALDAWRAVIAATEALLRPVAEA
jgi:hypothetical protein